MLDETGAVMRSIPIEGSINAQAVTASIEDENMLIQEGVNHFLSLLGDFRCRVRDGRNRRDS